MKELKVLKTTFIGGSKGDRKIKAWIDKREYISPEIVNTIIKLMGKAIRDEILAEIKGSRWYSVIADEAMDTYHFEQMSLSIRWVNNWYQVFEDTLAFAELPNTKAIAIYKVFLVNVFYPYHNVGDKLMTVQVT